MYQRIVVGVAKAEQARRASEVAIELAERLGAELHLVTAVPRGAVAGSPEWRGAEAFLHAVAPVGADVQTLPGDPAEVLLQVAGEVGADLIVVGNKGMHGVRRVLGSVPNDVAHGASCSVLIVDTV